ncbi:AFP-like protein 2 [Raphanus sativus]|uniref:Ninja-family protein n=1 Tax=Raphanus sativus TaxID=3726 RepID=A0A6J0MFS6_RAPSA|nr:AFP homolog 2 [Raphanus sativus]XP_018470964.1 AFP homolog 2 [Raphanus sativus]KAJ4913364.1 AFP-like protein 2 [Raphanus sativus]
MDDDNGLELSLGLSCGGGSVKGNITNNAGTSSSEKHIVEGGDRSAKVIDDFKNFLHPTSQRQAEASAGSQSQRSDSGQQQQPPQNFFNDLSKAPPTSDAEASTKPLWVEDETTRQEAGNKRKFGFQGMNDEKKKEIDSSSRVVDPHEKKTKASHVSNATDEGSTAENEDVAESEVGGGGSSSNLAKEVARPNADAMDNLAGQRKNSHGAEEFTTMRNMSYNTVPFTVHPQKPVTGLPYSAKESGQHAAATSLTQLTANAGNNLPVMFGYSPVQLPMLDKDGSGGIAGLSQSPFAARGPSNSATAKGEGKQPVAEEGSSEDASERPSGDNNNSTAFSFDFSAIKPGMAADVKFGGSGARPNLPWVSTTGSGPHGRTISGVTYRYNANQIKIVCACHGSHMSPEEFVRHASEEYVSPESSVGMTAASAHT